MPRTTDVMVPDGDGGTCSVTIRKFTEGDRYSFRETALKAAKADDPAGFMRADYKVIALGVVEWDFDAPTTEKGIMELDPETVDALLDEIMGYNPVVFPSKRPTRAATESSEAAESTETN
jgi:hypothetical protein